jgi:hypothetical protein
LFHRFKEYAEKSNWFQYIVGTLHAKSGGECSTVIISDKHGRVVEQAHQIVDLLAAISVQRLPVDAVDVNSGEKAKGARAVAAYSHWTTPSISSESSQCLCSKYERVDWMFQASRKIESNQNQGREGCL